MAFDDFVQRVSYGFQCIGFVSVIQAQFASPLQKGVLIYTNGIDVLNRLGVGQTSDIKSTLLNRIQYGLCHPRV